MNKKNIPVVIQLKQNNNLIIQGINQNDAGVLFDMKIMDGLEEFDFSGYSLVTLKIIKPDGTFTIDSDGVRVDVINPQRGRLKLNIPTSCTAQNGMHFCKIGFSFEESTLFETTSFNYFVGVNPHPDDEDIIGTDEYPILGNLIASVSGIQSAEEERVFEEEERASAEAQRQATFNYMMARAQTVINTLDHRLSDAESMLTDVLQALADGGSVDISQLNALATKIYVQNYVKYLDFGINPETGTKDKELKIYTRSEASMPSYLELGELGYSTDTHKLFIGNSNNIDGDVPNTIVNEPCFIANSAEPTDTSKLWIDTSGTAPIIKYYDGEEWVACNTAVFA